jgi:hypothetical protein
MNIRHTAILAISFVAGGLIVAAPAKKEKDDPPGPITAEQLDQSANNLKQIAIAWHNFESVNGHLPSNQLDDKGKALLSWRVQILPYIEQDELYKQFKLDEPWDSDHNKKLVDKMPKLFAPIRVKADAGMTFYQSFVGKNAVIKPGKKTMLATITDGTSNTFLAAESAKPVIWTKPDDMMYDGNEMPNLGGLFDGKFHAVFCDGHHERFKKGIDSKLLGYLIDPADGNVFDLSGAIDDGKD